MMELGSRARASHSTSPESSIAPGEEQSFRLRPFPCLWRRQQRDRPRVGEGSGSWSQNLAKGGWKESSHLSFRLMAATISAVQPSLCLALTSAPSDKSLERDRNIFSVWFIMDIRVEDMKNQQGGYMDLEIVMDLWEPNTHPSSSGHYPLTPCFLFLSLFP